MAQDIRKLMQEDPAEGPKLSSGHEDRFGAKLDAAFAVANSEVKTATPTKESVGFPWMKIAAIALVMLAVSVFGYYSLVDNNAIQDNDFANTSEENINSLESPQITLGSLSPDLKKVEEFYVAGINLQLASLQITDDNKDIIDGYMEQLSELDREYTVLNAELNEVGPTESTITALIDNLKFRLELLFKLKNKLKELKNQNNEQFSSIQT